MHVAVEISNYCFKRKRCHVFLIWYTCSLECSYEFSYVKHLNYKKIRLTVTFSTPEPLGSITSYPPSVMRKRKEPWSRDILVPRAPTFSFFLNCWTSGSGSIQKYLFFHWLSKTWCAIRWKMLRFCAIVFTSWYWGNTEQYWAIIVLSKRNGNLSHWACATGSREIHDIRKRLLPGPTIQPLTKRS